ncbi:metallophosphoesterase [Rhizobium sp. BK251]|uniref:metallophosphoesterase n=1 Tax=Rhizobium sp. BK251 TaxID=2512125 RepID=UPI0010D5BC3B|nr:metallophosphoesterase [Rhizobium sp. BK251]TCL74992.1 cytolysin (calcineurin-like family phosphatase) [Rhizobium sp. BK251]
MPVTRRSFMRGGLGTGLAFAWPFGARADRPATDATFLVINDVHACRMDDGLSPNCEAEGKTNANLLRHIAALNNIPEQRWPTEIGGKPTGLTRAGQPIGRPRGVIVCGDVTDDGGGQTAEPREGTQLLQFSHRYQQGQSANHIHYPVYVGLGNHDLDQDGHPPQIDWYRDELRDYVRLNHKPSVFFKPLVPVDSYDTLSDSYSWNWGGLHLVQLHRYGGDTNKRAASGLEWLRRDLALYASDGRPVVMFQHYGWDPFSLERWDPANRTFSDTGSGTPHWWDDAERDALFGIIRGYNVVGIFHGHEHDTPMAYQVNGIDIIKAKAAFMGGFVLARATDTTMDVVLGEAIDDRGGVKFTTAFAKTFK